MQDDQFPYHDRYDWADKVFLGEGAFGRVFKCVSKQDGQFYAIKQMKMEHFNQDPQLMNSLKNEISITTQCNSAHTVNMLDHRMGNRYTYIVLELCDSDLRKELASHKFTEPDCVRIFEDIMIGMRVLVDRGYIHRDIKPANVLVKSNRYKVADFGFATAADISARQKLKDVCGTPIYMAPQLLINQPYTAKSDVWSLGLMLYEMIFGYPPWPCRSLEEYLHGIMHRPLTFPYDAKIGQNTKDFLKKSLTVQEERRMGWQEVFSHPLIAAKQAGNHTERIQVDDYVKKVYQKLQHYGQKRHINWAALLEKHRSEKVNYFQVRAMLREVDPTITSHQVKVLFDHMDSKKQGWLHWEELEEKLLQVDYRSQDNVLDRKIDELVGIIQQIKADPRAIFQSIDLNQSGQLDFSQFSRFIGQIAPYYTKPEILAIFKLFDTDRSGLISQDEFLGKLIHNLPSQAQHPPIQTERAQRNLDNFVGYVKWRGISAEAILQAADRDHSGEVDQKEFAVLLQKLNFHISEEEVQQLYIVVNRDPQNGINLGEFVAMLK